MTTLAELADTIETPDLEATEAFRTRAGDLGRGTLHDIAAWLAGVQSDGKSHPPRRVRVVRFGFAADAAPPRAGAGNGDEVRNVPVDGDIAAAVTLGAAIADDEIDRGADLLVLVVARSSVAAEVVTAVLTNAEPVKVLPRGATLAPADWMQRAERVRDARRIAVQQRDSVDGLLAAAGDVTVAAATAFLVQSAARRTGVVLDGFAALSAALAAYELQTRTARWYRVADSSGSPGEQLALDRLGQRALLELGTEFEDGTAGLLAAIVVRFAVEAVRPGAA